MAYIKNPLDEQQDGTQPMTTSGQSSVVTGGESQDPNASAAQGTSWTNLAKYLSANEGLGGGIADTVTSGTQGKVDSAAGKINEYQTKAAAANSAGSAQTAKLDGYKTAIATDPTKVDSTAFRNDASAGYQGMTDATKADGYSDAYNAYGTAKDDYNNLKNNDWNARQSVVQATYGKDNAAYSKGMGLLDTLVLQGDAKGQEGINNFVSKNSGFIGDDTTNALATAKAGVQSGYDSEKGRWDTLLGSGDGSIGQALDSRKAGALAAIQGRQGQVDSANQSINEKQDVLANLAAELKTRGQTNAAYTPTAANKSIGDFSTDEDRALLDALSNLGAGDYDKSLVTKSTNANDPASLKYASGVGNANVQAEYDYDPTTNKLKTRNVLDSGPTNWVDMSGPGGSGSLGTWLDKYLKGKGY